MQLYTYWARASLDCVRADGRPYHLIAYAGSDDSPAGAQAAAQALLQRRQARLLADEDLGHYPTGGLPLREQVAQRIYDSRGELLAAITRNRYGSLVLNAPRMMFLDVDDEDLRLPLPPAPAPPAPAEPFSLGRWVRRVFFSAPVPAPGLVPLDPREQMHLRLAAWLQLHPEWIFRLYRTRLGYRLLVMHQLLAPDSPEARAVFAAMRTDEIYVRLCQTQGCYRARLTPKPWRIGWHRPLRAFPFDTPEEVHFQKEWEREYNQRSQSFSVCEWAGEFGTGITCPEARQLAELHDAACLGGRPLA
jgi:hypothetical protein